MTITPELPADGFDAFFHCLYGHKPFRWQSRLAAQACDGAWPRHIKLPTSSGKTSCIEVAVFALAHQAWRRRTSNAPLDAPRRIFFVVDRRVIVNEAYRRTIAMRDRLTSVITEEKQDSPLYPVAWWLRSLAGHHNAPPLDCFELRGGIYRDDAWVRSLLQPTVLTSTVDQIGSRLLFRGYGVSDRNLPIHAALTANDSLILLDEAHCSKPFSQTMEAIARYRDAQLGENESPRWAEEHIATPFRFIEMTATPRATSSTRVLTLEDADYAADPELEQRHGCAKPIRLVPSKATGAKQNQQLVKHLVEQAVVLAKGSESQAACRRVAIVVNRVACAREAYAILRKKHNNRVQLMIGRMRPLDRDRLTGHLQDIFRSGSDQELTEPHFVVATQCLEVGADFDFDGMVCQCASLDALRQRFGRLNRLGRSDHARGAVVMPAGDLKPKKADPIYAESLFATWQWLQENAEDDLIDFGVRAMDQLLASELSRDPDSVDRLTAPAPNAPVLMPAHLDMLCQTAPRPAVEPDVTAYLHGPHRGVPEVRICWRADLPQTPVVQHRSEAKTELTKWAKECEQVISPCPPSSAECVSVPLPQLHRWLLGIEQPDNSGDVLGGEYEDDELNINYGTRAPESTATSSQRCCVVWSGKGCKAASGYEGQKQLRDSIRPNSTIVLPASGGGWSFFGHVPNAPIDPAYDADGHGHEAEKGDHVTDVSLIDCASQAFLQSRARHILRVHRAFLSSDADRQAFDPLLEFVRDENAIWQHGALLPVENHEAHEEFVSPADTDDAYRQRAEFVLSTRRDLHEAGARRVKVVRYPSGLAVVGPRVQLRDPLPRESFDDEHDEHNLDADERLSLADHLADMTAETERLVSALDLPGPLQAALVAAAQRHDLGKADPRFQAMLLGSSIDLAWMQPRLWAKSARGGVSTQSSSQNAKSASPDSRLPSGFRHEMLSLQFAGFLHDDLDADLRELMLHVIAAHHGHARPFAPVVIDDDPPSVSLDKLASDRASGIDLRIEADDRRRQIPAHRLDSGISSRFWQLTHRYGWWGLAWLESMLRLADWTASADPQAKAKAISWNGVANEVYPEKNVYELPLPGLNGVNPLGFLAALGLFRTLSNALPSQRVEMTWHRAGIWHPVLMTDMPITEDALIDIIQSSLTGRQNEQQFTALGKNTTVPVDEFRKVALTAVELAEQRDRTFADFCAAFGSDALVSPNDGVTIQDSALRTMAGAGHQHFLETMRNLIVECAAGHLRKAIFHVWNYDDPTQTLSLRFDPLDDNRYALRWRNPSGDPDRKRSGSMLGANRLAIEALPLLTTAPGLKRLQTVGFTGSRSSDTYFHWPVWSVPLPISVVRSLMMLPDIVTPEFNADTLTARGVTATMCSQRITVGKVRNFTAAELKHSTLS